MPKFWKHMRFEWHDA